jgi:hypothetical protein
LATLTRKEAVVPIEESPDGKTIRFRRYNSLEPLNKRATTASEIWATSRVADEKVRGAQTKTNAMMRSIIDNYYKAELWENSRFDGRGYFKQFYMGNWEANMNTKKEFEQQVMDEVSRDGEIAGIKLYRNHYGCGLKEAKDAVEALMDGKSPVNPVTYRQVTRNDRTWERTQKPFSLDSLVRDEACISGLAEVLTWDTKETRTSAIRDGFSYARFKNWWNEGGHVHTRWLVDHGYLTEVKAPLIEVGDKFVLGQRVCVLSRVFINNYRYIGLIVVENGNSWHGFINVEHGTNELTIKQFEQVVGPSLGDIETTLRTQVKGVRS